MPPLVLYSSSDNDSPLAQSHPQSQPNKTAASAPQVTPGQHQTLSTPQPLDNLSETVAPPAIPSSQSLGAGLSPPEPDSGLPLVSVSATSEAEADYDTIKPYPHFTQNSTVESSQRDEEVAQNSLNIAIERELQQLEEQQPSTDPTELEMRRISLHSLLRHKKWDVLSERPTEQAKADILEEVLREFALNSKEGFDWGGWSDDGFPDDFLTAMWDDPTYDSDGPLPLQTYVDLNTQREADQLAAQADRRARIKEITASDGEAADTCRKSILARIFAHPEVHWKRVFSTLADPTKIKEFALEALMLMLIFVERGLRRSQRPPTPPCFQVAIVLRVDMFGKTASYPEHWLLQSLTMSQFFDKLTEVTAGGWQTAELGCPDGYTTKDGSWRYQIAPHFSVFKNLKHENDFQKMKDLSVGGARISVWHTRLVEESLRLRKKAAEEKYRPLFNPIIPEDAPEDVKAYLKACNEEPYFDLEKFFKTPLEKIRWWSKESMNEYLPKEAKKGDDVKMEKTLEEAK